MELRPRIKLKLSLPDRVLELTSFVFLIGLWALAIYAFINSPTIIPTHFNASGIPDVYGNKRTLLILPILSTIIYIGLTQLSRYPHILNYATKITESNAEKQYTMSTRLLRVLKFGIVLIFAGIILFTYLTIIGVTNGLGFWFLPLTIGLLFIPVIITLIKSSKTKNKELS